MLVEEAQPGEEAEEEPEPRGARRRRAARGRTRSPSRRAARRRSSRRGPRWRGRSAWRAPPPPRAPARRGSRRAARRGGRSGGRRPPRRAPRSRGGPGATRRGGARPSRRGRWPAPRRRSPRRGAARSRGSRARRGSTRTGSRARGGPPASRRRRRGGDPTRGASRGRSSDVVTRPLYVGIGERLTAGAGGRKPDGSGAPADLGDLLDCRPGDDFGRAGSGRREPPRGGVRQLARAPGARRRSQRRDPELRGRGTGRRADRRAAEGARRGPGRPPPRPLHVESLRRPLLLGGLAYRGRPRSGGPELAAVARHPPPRDAGAVPRAARRGAPPGVGGRPLVRHRRREGTPRGRLPRMGRESEAAGGAGGLDGPVDGSAPGAILFTSGSTGEPKGVVLSRGALARSADLVVSTFRLGAADRFLNLGGLHAMSGLRNTCLSPAACGAAALLASPATRGSRFSWNGASARSEPPRSAPGRRRSGSSPASATVSTGTSGADSGPSSRPVRACRRPTRAPSSPSPGARRSTTTA